MHALHGGFLHDLKDGILASLRDMVLSDTSLCLELRGGSINIYYRGGSLMKVEKSGDGYDVIFDIGYLGNKNALSDIPPTISKEEDTKKWIDVYPTLKGEMDRHFGKKRNRKDEREFQQLLVRENNFGRIAPSTDYFICDIEYRQAAAQFDAVAVQWPGRERKEAKNRRLVLIEMKYGESALKDKRGKSGLHKSGLHAHVKDINDYHSCPANVTALKKDMKQVFNQKRKLGLIECSHDLGSFSNDPPILLLVLANHNPRSSILRGLLKSLPDHPYVDLRIGTASFFGYGLYDQGIHTVEETFKRFGDYIHKDLPTMHGAGPSVPPGIDSD